MSEKMLSSSLVRLVVKDEPSNFVEFHIDFKKLNESYKINHTPVQTILGISDYVHIRSFSANIELTVHHIDIDSVNTVESKKKWFADLTANASNLDRELFIYIDGVLHSQNSYKLVSYNFEHLRPIGYVSNNNAATPKELVVNISLIRHNSNIKKTVLDV